CCVSSLRTRLHVPHNGRRQWRCSQLSAPSRSRTIPSRHWRKPSVIFSPKVRARTWRASVRNEAGPLSPAGRARRLASLGAAVRAALHALVDELAFRQRRGAILERLHRRPAVGLQPVLDDLAILDTVDDDPRYRELPPCRWNPHE